MHVVVLGDVMVELSCQVPYRFRDIAEDVLTYAPVTSVVGGTGANFAMAATRWFDEVTLGGCVGKDVFGGFAIDQLEAAGVRCLLRRTAKVPTGLAMYQRDDSTEATNGVRHLVIASPSANDAFTLDDVARLRTTLESADLVVADGYAMRQEERQLAVGTGLATAREAGSTVALDVVPHDCFRHHKLSDLIRFAAPAGVVMIEARTLLAFSDERFPEVIDDAALGIAIETAMRLWPDKVVLLRFGLGNVDEVFKLVPTAEPVRYRTGYAICAEPRGFGDRLAAQELSLLLRGQLG